MEFYFTGYLIAFGYGIFNLIRTIGNYNSIATTNFKKIDLFYNCWTGAYSPVPSSKSSIIFFAIWCLLISPIFSWLTVISILYSIFKAISGSLNTPEKVKEMMFKVKNFNLSKEEMLALDTYYKNEFSPQNRSDNNIIINAPTLPSINLSYFGATTKYEFNTNSKTFIIKHYDPELNYNSNEFGEYKFDNNKILIRILTNKSNFSGIQEEYIKDGVVLTSTIKKVFDQDSIITYDEGFKKYSKLADWNEVKDLKLNMKIKSLHPEIISAFELRKFARSETERIKSGRIDFANELRKINIDLTVKDEKVKIDINKNTPEDLIVKIKEIIKEDNMLSKFKITYDEVFDSIQTLSTLNDYLS